MLAPTHMEKCTRAPKATHTYTNKYAYTQIHMHTHTHAREHTHGCVNTHSDVKKTIRRARFTNKILKIYSLNFKGEIFANFAVLIT